MSKNKVLDNIMDYLKGGKGREDIEQSNNTGTIVSKHTSIPVNARTSMVVNERKPRVTKKGTIEVSCYLYPVQVERLDEMKRAYNAKSRSDIVRMAIEKLLSGDL